MDMFKLRNEIKHHEGFRHNVYQDSLGFWTIGYGFLVDKRKEGGGIPTEVADFWLDHNIDGILRALRSKLSWFNTAPDNVQRALVNMAYQMGVSGLLNFRNMLAALETGDYETAAKEALDSLWAKQTPERAKMVTDIMKGAGSCSAG